MKSALPLQELSEASDEGFVDLYAILGVPPATPASDLRRQIGLLYSEAKDNLEHRSFRKRFYYNELYEVHLPYAHHVLLDEARRAEYNALRESHLQSKTVVGAPAPPSAPPKTVKPTPAPPKTAPLENTPPGPAWARMDKADVERRRDSNRRELIKHELQAAGRRAGLGAGIGTFAAVFLLLFLVSAALEAGFVVEMLATVPALGAAYFAARAASRAARRNIIATLSQRPYEELLMRYSH